MSGAFNINTTLGALEIGVLVSSMLFGIVTSQTFTYYERTSQDSFWLKSMIGFIWLLELGHTVCEAHAVYTLTITDYGNLAGLAKFPQSYNAAVVLNGCITTLVQNFFAYRVRKLSKTLYIPILCSFLSVSLFVLTIVLSVPAFTSPSELVYWSQWQWVVTASLVLTATIDVTIAASSIFYLKKRRSSALKRTVVLLDHLMMWTLQTGLATSVVAVASLIASQVMKDNYVWIAIYTCLARLYSNSLLTLLNARGKLNNILANLSDNIVENRSRSISKVAPISIEMSQWTEVGSKNDRSLPILEINAKQQRIHSMDGA